MIRDSPRASLRLTVESACLLSRVPLCPLASPALAKGSPAPRRAAASPASQCPSLNTSSALRGSHLGRGSRPSRGLLSSDRTAWSHDQVGTDTDRARLSPPRMPWAPAHCAVEAARGGSSPVGGEWSRVPEPAAGGSVGYRGWGEPLPSLFPQVWCSAGWVGLGWEPRGRP